MYFSTDLTPVLNLNTIRFDQINSSVNQTSVLFDQFKQTKKFNSENHDYRVAFCFATYTATAVYIALKTHS